MHEALPKVQPIHFYNRYTRDVETEAVYGEPWLRFVYENPLGRLLLWTALKRSFFSRWYGHRMNQPKSKKLIAPFIERYQLDASEFAQAPDEFSCFNDFFSRRLKPEARPCDSDPSAIVFPADGRHLAFPDISRIDSFFVKGQTFDLASFLQDPELAATYRHGSLLLSRLCPVDYHRFHFPAAGTPGETRLINGPLGSVSPIALRRKLSWLWENKRTITELHTEKAGRILIVEIGATCVGTIRQYYKPGNPVEKGSEKGTFAFGGSSVITLFEPGKIEFCDDLLEHSSRQCELYARMGDTLGRLA